MWMVCHRRGGVAFESAPRERRVARVRTGLAAARRGSAPEDGRRARHNALDHGRLGSANAVEARRCATPVVVCRYGSPRAVVLRKTRRPPAAELWRIWVSYDCYPDCPFCCVMRQRKDCYAK